LIDESKRRNWLVAGICATLMILILIVFGQTIGNGFINFDDDHYVYQNPMVLRGLSLDGIGWAFTHVHSNNWHPLTTLLCMLDCQMYGLWAGGHHLTSVLLHAACAVLLFLLLLEMTGKMWRSGFVAAVFAIHPLRVESVAWVSELKDVLSGVFFMLTLWAYVRFTRRPDSKGRYAMVLIWFALGLMSKPMLVTVPFVLILLDYWPLGRFQKLSQLPVLLREKLPLFALSVLSCVATVLAQEQAIQTIEHFPLALRIGNALIAYVAYLGKLIWPRGLAVLYPLLKDGTPAWQVIDATLLLAALTAGAWLVRRKQPYLLVGWLWYLGMLAPVIGILQVGGQAYADRYTYLPQIGLCLAGTWMAAEWAGERRRRRAMLGSIASAILCALLAVAYHQTAYWRDSETLWSHTLECTRDNSIAHNNLGLVSLDQGRPTEATAHFREALRINPIDGKAYYNLGLVLCQQGHTEEAAAEFRKAIELNPTDGKAHNNLGVVLCQQGRMEQGIAEFRAALEIEPDDAEADKNLGNAVFRRGSAAEAIGYEQKALELQPADASAQNDLAWMLATAPQPSLRDGARAVKLAMQACRSSGGNNPLTLRTLAAAYAEAGQFPDAVQTAQRALQLAQAQSNTNLAGTLLRELKLYEAGRRIEEAR
jgi:tetratricopeptide (TPR) repeat protein